MYVHVVFARSALLSSVSFFTYSFGKAGVERCFRTCLPRWDMKGRKFGLASMTVSYRFRPPRGTPAFPSPGSGFPPLLPRWCLFALLRFAVSLRPALPASLRSALLRFASFCSGPPRFASLRFASLRAAPFFCFVCPVPDALPPVPSLGLPC